MRISLVNNEFSRTSQEVQRHVQTRFFLHTYSWQNEDNHDAQWLQYEIEGLRFWQSHTIFYPFWFHKKPSEIYKLLVKTRLFQDPREVQRHVLTRFFFFIHIPGKMKIITMHSGYNIKSRVLKIIAQCWVLFGCTH